MLNHHSALNETAPMPEGGDAEESSLPKAGEGGATTRPEPCAAAESPGPPAGRCPRCGASLMRPRRFPALAVTLVLAGCMLAFYLVGYAVIALGAWLWTRRAGTPRCPACIREA